MRRRQAYVSAPVMALALFGAALMPAGAAAQSQLDVAQAQEFMGAWLVTFETDDGPFLVELALTDQGGKVAASATTLPLGTQQVTDITRSEGTLVLKWEADAQGQIFPVHVELTSTDEGLAVSLDIGAGMLAMTGTAKRT